MNHPGTAAKADIGNRQDVLDIGSSQNAFGCFSELVATATVDKPVRLGLLGGSFDPVHNGHLLLAQFALEQHDLDGVLLIPVGFPFYKRQLMALTGRGGPAAAEARLEMLRLAIEGNPAFGVSRVEIDREGPTFTIDTIRILNGLAGSGVEGSHLSLYLIVGADALIDLPNWHESQAIVDAVTILYSRRPGTNDEKVQEVAAGSIAALPIDVPQLDISSTMIRKRIATGLPIRYLTPEAVVDYIEHHGLYKKE